MAKKILLIDSDAGTVSAATSDLESKGFEVLHTSDGKEGIDLARQHRPDLVVLCVELQKGPAGWGVCSKLKKDEELRSIPVILTSAQATQKTFDDHKKLKNGRADEYLIKPFQSSALVSKVEGLIGLSEPDGRAGDHDNFDVAGLAEEVAVSGEAPVTVDEVEEIALDEIEEVAPTPENLPGDEDLAVLDAAFENIAEKPKSRPPSNGRLPEDIEEPQTEEAPAELHAGGDSDDLLDALGEAPAQSDDLGGADHEEVDRLHDEIASLKRQLESASEAKPAPAGGTRDKDYFAAKEKLAQREKELLRIRDELNEKDKELVEQRDKETALEQQIAAHGEELAKRDSQIKSLQQKVEALVAGQKRTDRDLTAAREEARQASTKMQAAEQELSTVQTAAAEHEATAQRVTEELESARSRLNELETEVSNSRSRNDELSAELHGTRAQLEEAQTATEELRRRLGDIEDQNAKNEDRVVKAYQRIKGDEKLKEKVKKALGIALQLLEEQALEKDEGLEDRP